MDGVVSICNQALDLVGASPINDLADSGSSAQFCQRNWPAVRDDVLAEHPWNCALRRDQLAATDPAPAFKWAYAFNLPSDCLRIVGCDDLRQVDDWEQIADRKIGANTAGPLNLVYVASIEDVNLIDRPILKVMVYELAVRLAPKIIGSTRAMERLETSRGYWAAQARRIDSQLAAPKTWHHGDWLEARIGPPEVYL
ncbi:MAG: hypothetical protein KDA49_18725 [Rhodospirillaceae bacterium]|nr:hypothetical protein [Rhodospirillaceae bacterium]